MANDAVYIDCNKIASTGLLLNEFNCKREYKFLYHIADFISAHHYFVERGTVYWALSSLSKKKIKEILDASGISYTSIYTKWHFYKRTVYVKF